MDEQTTPDTGHWAEGNRRCDNPICERCTVLPPISEADRLTAAGLENLTALVGQLLHEHELHGRLLTRIDDVLAEVRERADSAAEEHRASGGAR